MASPPPADVESALLFGPPRSSRFASGEIPIVKSYRVCFAPLRALIVRVVHESIAFFKSCGELQSAPRKPGRDVNALSGTIAELLSIPLSRKTVGGKMRSPCKECGDDESQSRPCRTRH